MSRAIPHPVTFLSLGLGCVLAFGACDCANPAGPRAASAVHSPSGTAEVESSATPTADPAQAAGPAGGQSIADNPPTQPDRPPVVMDVFGRMASAGFTASGIDPEHPNDLADYLPIPPRAEGQIGRFTSPDGHVAVARVTYPAAVFATPHEQMIRERMTVLGHGLERVVRDGATIVHVRADSPGLAERVAALFDGHDEPRQPNEQPEHPR